MNNKKSKIYFFGGAGFVTGANFIFEKGDSGEKIMIDCGLIQGGSYAEAINREPFLYNPAEIKALLVTHAHIDHIGRIPKLAKEGFEGEIWSTVETKEIAYHMFEDAIKILEEEAKQKGVLPLYERADFEKAFSNWKTVGYHEIFEPIAGLKVLAMDAGHILGSVMYEIEDNGQKIVFTGDLGNSPSPLLPETEKVKQADYLVMESVYGDRNHEGVENRREIFLKELRAGIARGGTILIPAFSLEKTQVILHELNDFVESEKIKNVPVFLDSPLAIKITGIYRQSSRLFNEVARKRIEAGDDIFDFPKLKITALARQSDSIENITGPKIIIAGSGMSSGGRILKHEKIYLGDSQNTIIFLGFQSAGTLGRQIEEGLKKISISDEPVKILAKIVSISGYSSHKGGDELLDFVAEIKGLKEVFVTMGEPKASNFLAQRINDYLEIKAIVPEIGDVYELD